MKLYTSTQNVHYNSLIEVSVQTGETISAFTFEDSQGILVNKRDASYYYSEGQETFFLKTDKKDESMGWIWESVIVEDITEYENGKLYDLDNGQFVFESSVGKYGLFDDVTDIDDYIASL